MELASNNLKTEDIKKNVPLGAYTLFEENMRNKPMELPSSNLKTEDIKKNVQLGAYTLFAKENMRSIVWQSFRGVLDEYGEEIFGVSCCANCHTCIRYKAIKNGKSRDFGTKNLRDHMLYCGVPRKRGKNPSNEYQLHQPGNGTFKFQITNQDGNDVIQSTSILNNVVEERVGGGNRVVPLTPVCKVEAMDDQFLDQIHNHVTQISTDMASHATGSASPSEAPHSPKGHDFSPPSGSSYKRLKADADVHPSASSSSEGFYGSSGGYSTQPSSAESLKEDEHDIFGRHVANELRSLPDDANRRWARFQIQKALFEAHSCQKE